MKKYLKKGMVIAALAAGFASMNASAWSEGYCKCTSRGCVCVYIE